MGMFAPGGGLSIHFRVSDLLDKLRANLEKHQADYELAVVGYRKAYKAELEDRLQRLEAGELIDPRTELKKPVEYSHKYRLTIQMLEQTTDEIIELDQDQFNQLVNDDWEWKDHFVGTNSAYVALGG